MKHIIALTVFSISTIALSSCATTPDPAKVCTSDWIQTRADKSLDRIENKAGRSIKSLKKASDSWAKGKKPNPFQMLALSSSLKSLEKELTTGRGIKDLKTLASTCDDLKIISDAMGGFLRKQGLSENIINFIERMDLYQRIITPDSIADKSS